MGRAMTNEYGVTLDRNGYAPSIVPKKYRLYQTDNLDDAYEQGWTDALDNLENAPAADAAPVVHGRWIRDNDSFQIDDYYCCYFDHKCSECGEIVSDRYGLPNYCPNCGARMDLEDTHE